MGERRYQHSGDIGLAIFGLGRFIEYRLEEGQKEKDLFPWMQAYLNLSYRARGLEPPDLHELRARKVELALGDAEDLRAASPSWLPDAEKLSRLCPPLENTPSTSAPYVLEAQVSE